MNRFYLTSTPSEARCGFLRETIEECIQQATEEVTNGGHKQRYIVQIVAVVEKVPPSPPPVRVRWFNTGLAVLLGAFLLGAPAIVQAQDRGAPYIIFTAGQVADGWTTYRFITNGTGFESNALVGHDLKRVWAMKAVGVGTGIVVMKLLNRNRQHPKLARVAIRVIGYGLGGFGIWTALHNEYGVYQPNTVLFKRKR